MITERSSGAVLYGVQNGEPRFVLVRAAHYGFPKGHVERGESDEQAALREIREETGVNARLDTGFRREITYLLPGRKNVRKKVVLFIAKYDDGEVPHACSEIKGIAVETFDNAMRLLPHDSLRNVLKDARDYLTGSAPVK